MAIWRLGMPKLLDLTGRKFGRLVVLSRGANNREKPKWTCLCICGGEALVQSSNLISGNTTSCGCYARERISKRRLIHGVSGTKEYSALKGAINRCTNPRNPKWDSYGGRGISVCREWIDDPDSFIESLGFSPHGFTLERLNVNGNYEPGNCIWGSRKTQQRNRRNSVRLTFDGKTLCLSEWAERLNISYETMQSRRKKKWTIEEMLTIPLGGKRRETT